MQQSYITEWWPTCLLLEKKNEALAYLETALVTDPDKHYILFEYLPQLQDNGSIIEVINRYVK